MVQILGNQEQELTADLNQDEVVNIVDIILLVNDILGTTFRESVEWLQENFPQLEVEKRLQELDKSKYFAKQEKINDRRNTIYNSNGYLLVQ